MGDEVEVTDTFDNRAFGKPHWRRVGGSDFKSQRFLRKLPADGIFSSVKTLAPTIDDLIGTYRNFGTEGPVYEVLGKRDEGTVLISVVATGEQLDYPVEQALADPEAE